MRPRERFTMNIGKFNMPVFNLKMAISANARGASVPISAAMPNKTAGVWVQALMTSVSATPSAKYFDKIHGKA